MVLEQPEHREVLVELLAVDVDADDFQRIFHAPVLLLRLQARRIDNPEAREALDEAVRRVGAIAVVHETLAHTPGEKVDADEVTDRVIALVRDMAVGRNVDVTRVSSAAIVSTLPRMSSARRVTSRRFPTGVATTYNVRPSAGNGSPLVIAQSPSMGSTSVFSWLRRPAFAADSASLLGVRRRVLELLTPTEAMMPLTTRTER